jgi:hypothetical protein
VSQSTLGPVFFCWSFFLARRWGRRSDFFFGHFLGIFALPRQKDMRRKLKKNHCARVVVFKFLSFKVLGVKLFNQNNLLYSHTTKIFNDTTKIFNDTTKIFNDTTKIFNSIISSS